MPNRYIGVNGAWKPVVDNWIGVGGVWKPVVGKWIGVGGVWKKIWPDTAINVVLPADFGITDTAIIIGGTPKSVRAELQVQTDGDLFAVRDELSDFDVGDWVDNKTGLDSSLYEVRVTVVSGTLTGGSGTGSWLSLASQRSWFIQFSSSANNTKQTIIDVEIREIANVSNYDIVRVNLFIETAV